MNHPSQCDGGNVRRGAIIALIFALLVAVLTVEPVEFDWRQNIQGTTIVDESGDEPVLPSGQLAALTPFPGGVNRLYVCRPTPFSGPSIVSHNLYRGPPPIPR
jgi:hypothetical protein